MIAVVDYGMGNLHSMAKALEYIGERTVVTASPAEIRAADRVVLPGVGAFGECVRNLRSSGLVGVLEEVALEQRKPFLGVCVGMQLLASEGREHGVHEGLGWIPGIVDHLEPQDEPVPLPHTGWNEVEPQGARGPFTAVRAGEAFYFNHSYHFVPEDRSVVAATCAHGELFAAGLVRDNLLATQFHPEKSQQAGLNFLADFAVWEPGGA